MQILQQFNRKARARLRGALNIITWMSSSPSATASKSLRGTQFRMWATQRLREYIVKGFVLDDARLKQAGGGDHFDELLERIRDIRASERVFWRKVLDIYALSEDYDPRAESSILFFQTVQNKIHWAITGKSSPRSCTGGPMPRNRTWASQLGRRCAAQG